MSVLFFAVPTQALAVPVVLDASQRAAAARGDAGSGLCGAAIHFQNQSMALSLFSEASALLDKPKGDVSIADRVTRVFPTMNFRNKFDSAPSGDFSTPTFTDAWFPFSSDNAAMPTGDNSNIALRLRGYLNVQDGLKGKPVTFAVNCNDACELKIGAMMVVSADNRVSGRVTRQVQFNDSGLYPVEMVYYQNGSAAVLEWSRSDKAELEGPQATLDINAYNLLSPNELFSAIAGVNGTCQECGGGAGSCSSGNFCGNGLCQTCNVADHCGASCAACPSATPVCDAGQCRQCVDNSQCAAGMICTSGACGLPGGMCGAGMTRDDSGQCAQASGCGYSRGNSAAPQLGLFFFCLMLGFCLCLRRTSARE